MYANKSQVALDRQGAVTGRARGVQGPRLFLICLPSLLSQTAALLFAVLPSRSPCFVMLTAVPMPARSHRFADSKQKQDVLHPIWLARFLWDAGKATPIEL